MKHRYILMALIAGGAALSASASAVQVSIVCGAVGQELTLCKEEAEAWATKTGNTVRVLDTVNSTTDRLAYYQQNLSAGNSDIDVYQVDVVYPGLLKNYLLDLTPYLTKAQTSQYFPSIYENNVLNGKVLALPWFTDGGVLYYRKDLLAKYGYKAAPKTWQEMATMAKKIQDGEQKAGNKNFYGYVFQGKAYEGLTCDALEWINSFKGGTIIDSKGTITINNPNAIAALDFFAKQVKQISPPAVLTYDEEGARAVWQSGNAAFMRNWPYAYALSDAKDSPIAGKFGVSALPKGGTTGQSSATQGGWGLAVSKFSKHPKEAASLVSYLTGPEVQKERAIKGSYNPTIPSLYKDQDVLKATPIFGSLYDVFTGAVARPATVTGAKYNQVSSMFWTAVYNTLSGNGSAKDNLANLDNQLKGLKGSGW
ncbi:MAG TPA: ABC transporter substrate-binding protein [Deinococcales bacterium]|nr:ABC transporter substrate-binding protein [Deinococcales bacterium]